MGSERKDQNSSSDGHFDDTYSYTASDGDSSNEAQSETLVAHDPTLVREVRDAVRRLIVTGTNRSKPSEPPKEVRTEGSYSTARYESPAWDKTPTTRVPDHQRVRRLSRKEAVSDLKHQDRLQVQGFEHPQASHQAPAEPGGSTRLAIGLVLGAFFVVLAGYGAMAVLRDMESALLRDRDFGDCGSSVTEARARGCVLDLVNLHWVRPECYYRHIQEEYRSRINITYYRNSSLELESAIPVEMVFDGTYQRMWTHSQHKRVQCAYMTDILSSALIDRLPVDSETADRDRIKRCSRVLMGDWSHETRDCRGSQCASQVATRFTGCSYVQDRE